jgi:FG-GAP repeat
LGPIARSQALGLLPVRTRRFALDGGDMIAGQAGPGVSRRASARRATHRLAAGAFALAFLVAGAGCGGGGSSSGSGGGASGSFSAQGAKLTASDAAKPGQLSDAAFGSSVTLSTDGSTALVGSYKDGGGAGAAFVYTRSGSDWKQQAVLHPNGQTGSAWFGRSVALSADGNTALIGGPQNGGTTGAVWIFVRSGSTWTQQAMLLPPSRGKNQADYAHGIVANSSYGVSFGTSVALSADGNTGLVGASAYGGFSGAAFAFVRSGSKWALQDKEPLRPKDAAGLAAVGGAVGLSADGNTALVGGSGDHSGAGAAWEFVRKGSTWTQAGPKIKLQGARAADGFACSLSVSSDATVAVFGACTAENNTGAAWIFTRTGSTWQQGAELEAGADAVGGSVGYSVGLSGDGLTAVVGAPSATSGAGAAWVYTGSGAKWGKPAALDPQDPTGATGGFGFSVAMSPDGTAAIVGSPNDDTGAGSASMYTRG